MIKHLDLETDLNLSVVLLSSDLPLASPCEERPLASPCGANNPPPAAAAACQSIIVIFGENKQKQSADKRKNTHLNQNIHNAGWAGDSCPVRILPCFQICSFFRFY